MPVQHRLWPSALSMDAHGSCRCPPGSPSPSPRYAGLPPHPPGRGCSPREDKREESSREPRGPAVPSRPCSPRLGPMGWLMNVSRGLTTLANGAEPGRASPPPGPGSGDSRDWFSLGERTPARPHARPPAHTPARPHASPGRSGGRGIGRAAGACAHPDCPALALPPRVPDLRCPPFRRPSGEPYY